MKTQLEQDTVRETVRAHYSQVAERAEMSGDACGCSTTSSCCGTTGAQQETDYVERLGYSPTEAAAAPEGSNLNLGCGNPHAIASIQPGETVVDLGSGAGFDCFLAANQLAGTGSVIGVDMTPAMVAKARRNAARSGHANVEFRLGEIEALPVADATADLVISNCVINLSPDKPRVLRETFRILKSGGRLAIADVVARRPLPEAMRSDPALLAGCVGGAETVSNLQHWLADAGFVDVRITERGNSAEIVDSWSEGKALGDFVVSAILQARKP